MSAEPFEQIAAYPLAWPVAWPRARSRARANFYAAGAGWTGEGLTRRYDGKKALSIAVGVDRLVAELKRLGAAHIVISTNVRTGRDGYPRGSEANPKDPGAAVYFRLKGEPRVLACDKWDRLADNLAALAKHIEAARGQVRWGVGTLEQAFGGYKALPAVGEKQPWWIVLGLPQTATRDEIDRKRTDLLRKYHPDVTGGSHTRAAEINAAYSEAIAS